MKANQFGLRESDLENMIKIFKQFDSISEAILFGSRAKGNYRHGSDIDIALKGDIDFRTIARLSYLLNQDSLMPYKFDLVNYARLEHQELKEHIDRVGVPIYWNNISVSA